MTREGKQLEDQWCTRNSLTFPTNPLTSSDSFSQFSRLSQPYESEDCQASLHRIKSMRGNLATGRDPSAVLERGSRCLFRVPWLRALFIWVVLGSFEWWNKTELRDTRGTSRGPRPDTPQQDQSPREEVLQPEDYYSQSILITVIQPLRRASPLPFPFPRPPL